MAGLLEVAASIAAGKEETGRVGVGIAASKDAAGEVADALYAMGVGGRAERMRQSVAALEEAEAIRAQLEAKLEEARQQVLAASEGSGSRAGSGSSAGSTAAGAATAAANLPPPGAAGGGGGSDNPPPTDPPTPAAPGGDPEDEPSEPPNFSFSRHYRPDPELTKKIGELWDPPEVSDLEEERSRTKTFSVGRNLVRNGEDIHSAGKQFGETLGNLAQSHYDPLEGAVAETAADTNSVAHQVATRPEVGPVDLGSLVGTGLMMGAVVVEGVGRFMEARERKVVKESGN